MAATTARPAVASLRPSPSSPLPLGSPGRLDLFACLPAFGDADSPFPRRVPMEDAFLYVHGPQAAAAESRATVQPQPM